METREDEIERIHLVQTAFGAGDYYWLEFSKEPMISNYAGVLRKWSWSSFSLDIE